MPHSPCVEIKLCVCAEIKFKDYYKKINTNVMDYGQI